MRITKLSTWILAGMLGIAAGAGGVLAAQGAGAGATPVAANCAVSQPTGAKVSGSGPHEVIVEYNCSPGISTGTIFRPADMKGKEKYPIFVWGEGGCSQNGMSNAAAMAEIASHGYFVIADGTPTAAGRGANIPMGSGDVSPMGKPLIGYIDWAIAENSRPTSAYYGSLDTKKIASNGFSCGGLMAIGTVGDPRITAWGVTSSGMKRVNDDFYRRVHTPVLFVEGGSGDVAYEGGQMGFAAISKLGVPVLWFSKDIGHGGDLSKSNGGDFGRINLAWLNWQLKGDAKAAKMFKGADCTLCTAPSWHVTKKQID